MCLKRDQEPIRNFWILTVSVVAFLTCVLFLVYGLYISYHNPVVTYIQYTTKKVDSSFRTVLISDLHDAVFDSDNQILAESIKNLQPDLIFLCGDMVNSTTSDFAGIENFTREMTHIAPTILSLGNQEVNNKEWEIKSKNLIGNGTIVLDRDFLELNVNDNMVRIGGLYDYSFSLNGENTVDLTDMEPDTVTFLQNFVQTDSLKILLAHRPDSFIFSGSPDYWDVDLVLSGHYHKGQVVLWNNRGLWAPDQGWFPEYAYGWTRIGSTDLFTTAGLSSGKEKLPRFNNPPEIVCLTIQPE